MARPRGKSETRKREILENFYAVIAEVGLEGASMAKIAARMGIHPSLIVHYFSNKEEMVVALVDFMLAKYEETFLPRLREIEEPEERLHRTLDAIFSPDWSLVDHSVFYGCYSLACRNDRVRKSFQRMYSSLREVLSEEIGELVHRGVIAGDDPARLADLIISLLEGYDFYRGIAEDGWRCDELGRLLKENALVMLGSSRQVEEGQAAG